MISPSVLFFPYQSSMDERLSFSVLIKFSTTKLRRPQNILVVTAISILLSRLSKVAKWLIQADTIPRQFGITGTQLCNEEDITLASIRSRYFLYLGTRRAGTDWILEVFQQLPSQLKIYHEDGRLSFLAITVYSHGVYKSQPTGI